jgi:hypothetical protein
MVICDENLKRYPKSTHWRKQAMKPRFVVIFLYTLVANTQYIDDSFQIIFIALKNNFLYQKQQEMNHSIGLAPVAS